MADWTTGRPAYHQVADALRRKIRAGDIPVGDQIPSYSQLMREFGVSITVVRSAVAALRTEGLLATQQGKGAFVLTDATGAVPQDAEVAALRRDLEALAGRVAELEARDGGR